MKEYDVIVVGTGPAGFAAAKVLKENNISYCIIEKESLPRFKLCGGGLTNKAQIVLNRLKIDMNNIPSLKCESVKFISEKRSKDMKLLNPILMVNRMEFDYSIIKEVANDNLFEHECIKSIENNVLTTNKDEYKFRYIIFADGVNGYSRRFVNNRKFGFSVEYNCEAISKETIFDFTAIENGYGWVFPKKEYTTIGLGRFDDKKDDFITLLENFSQKHGFKFDKTKVRGYHIPIFSKEVFKKSVIDNKYVLVGDAASLADGLTGEGIYYALYSGAAAAESICLCMKNNCNLEKTYFSKTKKISSSLTKRMILSKMMYSKHSNFYIKLGLSNKFFEKKLNKIFG